MAFFLTSNVVRVVEDSVHENVRCDTQIKIPNGFRTVQCRLRNYGQSLMMKLKYSERGGINSPMMVFSGCRPEGKRSLPDDFLHKIRLWVGCVLVKIVRSRMRECFQANSTLIQSCLSALFATWSP